MTQHFFETPISIEATIETIEHVLTIGSDRLPWVIEHEDSYGPARTLALLESPQSFTASATHEPDTPLTDSSQCGPRAFVRDEETDELIAIFEDIDEARLATMGIDLLGVALVALQELHAEHGRMQYAYEKALERHHNLALVALGVNDVSEILSLKGKLVDLVAARFQGLRDEIIRLEDIVSNQEAQLFALRGA